MKKKLHKVKRERIHSIKRGGWEVLEGAGEERSPAKDNQVDTHWQDAKPISTCAFPQLLRHVHDQFTFVHLPCPGAAGLRLLQSGAASSLRGLPHLHEWRPFCHPTHYQSNKCAHQNAGYRGQGTSANEATIKTYKREGKGRKNLVRCCCLQQWR